MQYAVLRSSDGQAVIPTVTLAGCGHVPFWDDPEQVAQMILKATSYAPRSAVRGREASSAKAAQGRLSAAREVGAWSMRWRTPLVAWL